MQTTEQPPSLAAGKEGVKRQEAILPAFNLQASGLEAAAQFLQERWLAVLGISAAVLAPCFWHQRIEAGDLGSHVYNAWLAQLIERGQAPGLWIAHQSSNILFDVTLSKLGSVFGLRAAEKIAVAAAVLVFFWGAFALICASARRIPWFVLPCVAMFTYGWTFQEGFLNYYISLGLAFWGLAIVQGGTGWERSLAAALVPLIWMAHPLGLAFLLGAGTYIAVAKLIPNIQKFLFGGSCILLFLLGQYFASHYPVVWVIDEGDRYILNGTDQLFLYGSRYHVLSYLLLGFILFCLLTDVIIRRATPDLWGFYKLPLQLYAVALLAAFLLPSIVSLPQYNVPVTMLTERLTSVSAVLACCLLGAMKPQKWHLAGFLAIAAVYFFFLHGDTGRLNKMESQAERYERTLPPGQRVIATIWSVGRVFTHHIVDHSCVGHCFSYGNYEPSSEQFRVRALPGNPFVVTNQASVDAIQSGEYVVQPQDLPLFEIYQCDLSMTELCMRKLAPGEKNGAVGFHPIR